MRKFLRSSLIAVLSTFVASTSIASVSAAEVSPANLVSQGYQGRLNSEGIPGYAPFLQGVYFGKIDAEALIASAVAQGKLDASAAKDQSYVRKVKTALFLLRTNGSSR